FIGVAGQGMSAIAQYLQGIGKEVRGSDRYFIPGKPNATRDYLEKEGIRCFLQNGEGIDEGTDLVVISTAVEDTVQELVLARQRGIPVILRAELLALIAKSKRTIAVGGTSGKSTTSSMIFDILEEAGLQPGIISGAGLTRLIAEGKLGNAKVGKGDWLIIEADESDGSIVLYEPEIGLLLNIDKDHKDIDELMDVFRLFQTHTTGAFIVNRSHPLAAGLSVNIANDFSSDISAAGFQASNFKQEGLRMSFLINEVTFTMNALGKHNMENALAAVTVSAQCGVSLEKASLALSKYEGIYRRNQVFGCKKGVWMIDDYAHNPVKCAAAIRSCQPLATKVVSWFQPHGYGPTKFLRKDFVDEIAAALRPQDEIWMSEIFYAGGTAVKDISAADLIQDLQEKGCQAFFIENRNDFLVNAKAHLSEGSVLLLMGARDPSLESFAKQVWEAL
ncbi:MAG: UDP-N-acetylmuramate--L-alanine ligase, partial [Bacteroidota bacterium]